MIGGGARTAVLFAALAIPLQSAGAAPFYFHKASVDREAFVADFSLCQELAGGVRVEPVQVYSPNIYAVAAASFFAPFFASAERRHMANNVLRTCMADKGYRRVEATSETRKELKRLDEKARVDRLFSLASAPAPDGKVLPR
jgi:hypothetical protein